MPRKALFCTLSGAYCLHRRAILLCTLSYEDWITNLNTAHLGSRAAQPNQIIPVDFISPLEIVNNPGNRASRPGIPDAVGELVVLDY